MQQVYVLMSVMLTFPVVILEISQVETMLAALQAIMHEIRMIPRSADTTLVLFQAQIVSVVSSAMRLAVIFQMRTVLAMYVVIQRLVLLRVTVTLFGAEELLQIVIIIRTAQQMQDLLALVTLLMRKVLFVARKPDTSQFCRMQMPIPLIATWDIKTAKLMIRSRMDLPRFNLLQRKLYGMAPLCSPL